MLLIVASSVTIALDTPSLDPHSRLGVAIRYLDYAFTGAFTLEALLKIITFGFAFTGKHAYIRSGWNVLDFLIVLVGFALTAIQVAGKDGSNLQMLRVLRTLRALRPLRAASRYEGLRVVVNALFAVIPAMMNVALVCVLFYVIFAILSVNLFKGKLYSCVDADSGERLDPEYLLAPGQTLTRQWCEAGSVTVTNSAHTAALNVTLPEYNISTAWVNQRATFDHVGAALLTLFQVATLELWVDITFSAVDATAEGQQPLWNHNPAVALFFVAFIVVGSFFVLNLFVGVTLDKFSEMQTAQTASSVFMTAQQQSWVDVQKLLLRTAMQLRPPRPEGPRWKERLYDCVTHDAFDHFILAAVLVNVVFMATVHAGMSSAWQGIMSYSNLTFTLIFVLEAGAKMAAFGYHSYFRERWTAFDFFVVLISAVSVALDFSNTKNLSFMPALRVLRVVRIFRLIPRMKGLQRLFMTLVHSLPSLVNVGGMMLLLFFVYAVIGMNLFGGIMYGSYLTRHANFNNFPNAMLTLMRMLTGESWDGIMQDCMVTHGCVLLLSDTVSPATGAPLAAGSYLDPGDPALAGLPEEAVDNQCAISPAAAVIYFPTFVILCSFILLNLIIAVILENMVVSETDEELPVSKSMIRQFVDVWSSVDPAATGFIHASRLPLVIGALDPPLGTRTEGKMDRSAVQSVILSVDIPIHENNTVTFIETLHALSGRVAGTELPDIEEQWLFERFSRRLPGGGALFPKYTAAHFHAALHVQAAVRGFMARHRLRGMMRTLAGGKARAAAWRQRVTAGQQQEGQQQQGQQQQQQGQQVRAHVQVQASAQLDPIREDVGKEEGKGA
ncbi:hypothetical protein Agub_g7487 [Astrephomene gubernaculifera]|uniref:Voltage-gated ion channel superfamily n=1 Tax=Astrephomene gubernaculifera TaxID=47775 RepID=A0AAD3HLR2_9CHLO|nr:hypothetical protein Agub_g7487 [Astrephomene gubernaculifera]